MSASSYLERGAAIGRYIVLEMLGEGGMGVVYSAYDPELDRKVAIKLMQVQPGGSSPAGGEQALLLREAQALARLAHPNVVGVHDVGSLPGDRVFVAMEHVDGVTLRAWLKETRRSWRESLPILVAAGTGLAAAHAAGLVHRDFKPDNVIVGADGRVRVMDFGLARLRAAPDVPLRSSDLEIAAKSPLTDSMTVAGSVVGTPAYMAPEIYDGKPADAFTDQFAFGVTLFEALFGKRPFAGFELAPPRTAPPKPTIPSDTRVPTRLQRAVLRTLALDPAQRFPTMAALLGELAIDPFARRRRVVAAVGALAVLAGAAGVAFAMHRATPKPCQGIASRLEGVWDPARKQQIRAAFVATKRPDAADAYTRLERALDGYASEWTTISTESCTATRIRGEQTEQVLSLRQTCLEQRREELRALTEQLGESSTSVVDKGEKMAWELEPLATCSNVAMLRAPGTPPLKLRPIIDAIGKQLAEAKAQLVTRKLLPALVTSQKAYDAAKAIRYEPYQAEALLVRATAYAGATNLSDAAATFIEAAWIGIHARRDDIVASAAISAALMVSEGLGKPGEARFWANLGEQFAKRAGTDRALEPRIYEVKGVVAAQSGDTLGAVAAHEKAFDAIVRVHGRESPALWQDESLLATTLVKAQAYARAIPYFEHSLAIHKKVVGPDSIEIALVESNLGIAYAHLGDYDKARTLYEHTIAVREKLFGKTNALLVVPLVNYADLKYSAGDASGALPIIERAKSLAEHDPGPEHPNYHECITLYGQILAKLGQVASARNVLDDVMVIEARVGSSVLPTTQAARAEIELGQKQWAEATRFAERAIAGYETAGGTENPELWRPLTWLARAKLGQGDRGAAKPLVERAIAIGRHVGVGDHDLKPALETLGSL